MEPKEVKITGELTVDCSWVSDITIASVSILQLIEQHFQPLSTSKNKYHTAYTYGECEITIRQINPPKED